MSNVLWSRPPFILFIVASSKTLKCPSGGHQPQETAAPDAENQEQELNSHKSMTELSKKPESKDTERGGKEKNPVFLNEVTVTTRLLLLPPPRLNLV